MQTKLPNDCDWCKKCSQIGRISLKKKETQIRKQTLVNGQFIAVNECTMLFFSVVQQPNSGLGRLIVEVSISHTIRHTHTR
jgi:hypothetical protein